MQHNQEVMAEMIDYLRVGSVVAGKVSIRMIHGGTVRPFGASPGTPVDTGEARSGGRVALNVDPSFRPPDEAPFYPIMGDDEIDGALGGMQLGDTIHWRNRVPYSGLLEDPGTSPQAPDGFLGHSIAETKVRIEDWEYREGLT